MKIQKFLPALILSSISAFSFSQSFMVTDPKLEFDGYKLSITYDLVTKENSDIFYVWVEIKNQAGNPIRAYSFKGEIGDSIKPGTNKRIEWIPEEDAIYLDEDISVEMKSERYEWTFKKGSALFSSVLVPGLGLTKIKNGKPYWLAAIPAYGALAGGLVIHSSYVKTFDAYRSEVDPVERGDLWDKSIKEKNLSIGLIGAAAVIWVADLVWVASTPNKYRPLKHPKLYLNCVPLNGQNATLLTLKVDF
jgi:hypothetical protein